MKKYYLVLLSCLLINGCSKNSVNWYNDTLENALTNADSKIIMLDFYTDW